MNIEKLKFIPKEEVPSRKTKWNEIFDRIPSDQALVLTRKDVNPISVQHILRRRHNLGEYLYLNAIIRNHGDILYIINEADYLKWW